MSNKYFSIFALSLLYVGLLLGWCLWKSSIGWVKWIDILGSSYNLLGLVILSELIVRNKKLKKFCVDYIAPGMLWTQTIIPLGMAISYSALSWYNSILFYNSVLQTSQWTIFFLSLIPLFILDCLVVNPATRRTPDVAYQIFGFSLFLIGNVLQLIVAVWS